MSVVPTVEAMALAIQREREQLDEARARVEELKGPYEDAVAKRNRHAASVKAMETAMEIAKRAHMIERALVEAGIEYEGPRVVAAPVYRGHHFYFLVAVAQGGTGLYLYTPERSHRHHAKEHAVLAERLDDLAVEHPTHFGVHLRDASPALRPWEARGRGEWGAGSGAMRPQAPPEGGRWRWLKLREQEALPA